MNQAHRLGLLSLLLLAILAPSAQAQGTLVGTVTDADFGDPLPGVNIVVVGTSFGTATGPDGRYSIPGLRAGDYSIRVSYIGFETKLFTDIEIDDGETTTLDIELAEAVLRSDEEVVVIGERPLLDVEDASSTVAISREAIEAAPVREVQAVVAQQAGVVRDPTGLYIRGGRAEETAFIVDGVSAKDPLAGTGFGLDLGSNAFQEVEVTTGGVGADVGDVTSGVVSVRTQDGSDEFEGFFGHKRDNLGFNRDWESTFMEETFEASLSGPIVKGKLRFFASGQAQFSDGFTREIYEPEQVESSLIGDDDFWMPRTGNRWNGLVKLTYDLRPGMRLQTSYQRSLTVNQNTRMLQVTGNDAIVAPGFQYAFIEQPDNANTFAHDNKVAWVKWSHVLNDRSFYDVQVSRLFTRLRADANGRDWRPLNVDTELDPASIPDYPVRLFLDEDGNPLDPNAQFILPGSGFINNGGLATRWHDHFAEEVVVRGTYTLIFASGESRLNVGFDMKFNDYQWIDVVRPWVGAPVGGEDGTATQRLGESADIWRVKPRRGAIFGTQQIRYRGLIANLGARLEYWQPGKYVDELVEDPQAPILPTIRESYQDGTVGLFGLRTKLRLLPKLSVSFPIRENLVMFFNYGHSQRVPHPTFVYTGLDPFFQDRSFFADLGNPDLDPEVDISYEIGVRSQFSSNDVLSVTAFWRDKFDFITAESAIIRDASGRETTRAFRVNGDFARVRGIEVSYLKRVDDWLQGRVSGSFSRATGLSSTNNDAIADFLANGNVDNTFETPLAWDRPLDLKGSLTFSRFRDTPLWGIPGLNNVRAFISTTWRSGQRYTPVEFVGFQTNPFTGEQDWRPIYERVADPAKRFSEVGAPWWWFDLNVTKGIPVYGTTVNLSLEVTNLFNQNNGVIINPVTGEAFPEISAEELRENAERLRDDRSYDVTTTTRDLRYEDPRTGGLPPLNPARFLPQRHIMLGLSFRF
jgi:outer membrane receptor protein involved in Fe transport